MLWTLRLNRAKILAIQTLYLYQNLLVLLNVPIYEEARGLDNFNYIVMVLKKIDVTQQRSILSHLKWKTSLKNNYLF